MDSEEVLMRKVVASEFVSLDGVVESPEKWYFPYFNDQMEHAIGAAMAASDAMLMGRVLYEEWAAFWPKQDPDENPVAARMNGVRKYLVSTTLEEPLQWQNSTLIGDNVAEEISRLKEQPGKDISISGSPTLVRSLLEEDLLDELRLMVHPIVVGSGKRLFEDGEIRRRCSSSTRRPSAQAFFISPTNRREAEAINRAGRAHSGPFSCPYSPECVEGVSLLKKSL
jgi:dihydrofolate reductase